MLSTGLEIKWYLMYFDDLNNILETNVSAEIKKEILEIENYKDYRNYMTTTSNIIFQHIEVQMLVILSYIGVIYLKGRIQILQSKNSG
jgi:hypothetical protein